jgi:hypothetical protein
MIRSETTPRCLSACIVSGLLAAAPLWSAEAPPIAARMGPLPEGNRGIAARYPRDAGIAADPAVLLADGFDDCTTIADLHQRWQTVHHESHLVLATDPAQRHLGSRSLQFTLPRQAAELSHAIARTLSPGLDLLFLRYYAKFEPPFDIIGSSHNGCTISGRYFVDGRATPGIPADGRNKFLAALEHWRGEAATAAPGELNVYLYHPGQRSQWGDHFFPSGKVLPNSSLPFDFGPTFTPRPDVVPPLGQWHCHEFMVALNTPGRRDGRIACWLDGRLAADFPNLRLRDVCDLKIDRFGLNLHAGTNPNEPARQWVDSVVAATGYIGPATETGPRK